MVFNNYITVALRNIRRNRWYSAINIFGLAVGLASAILLFLYVKDELSYDKYHPQSENIYRVSCEFSLPNYHTHFARVPFGYINNMPRYFPEIRQFVRLGHDIEAVVRTEDKKFHEDRFFLTDPDFFSMFNINLIEGDENTALLQPGSIVITQEIVEKYFGDDDPIGKRMTAIRSNKLGEKEYVVTGILEQTPANSHFHIDLLASHDSRREDNADSWNYCYLLLNDDADPKNMQDRLPDFVAKYTSPETSKHQILNMMSIKDIHLRSHLDREIEPNGNILYVYIFLSAGILILIIAAINFANLSVSQSINRSIEAGIRKTIGAYNRNLILQYLVESILISFISLVVAFIIVELAIPGFNQLSGKNIEPLSFIQSYNLIYVVLLATLIGLVSGVYPAIYFATVKPMSALNNNINYMGEGIVGRVGRFSLRNVLVVIQFVISISLLICCFMTYSQHEFLMKNRLGEESEQVLALPKIPGPIIDNYELLKREVIMQPGILDMTATMEEPSRQVLDAMDYEGEGLENSLEGNKLYVLPCDSNFIEFWNIDIVAGSDFREVGNQGEETYIINETAAKTLGLYPYEKAIGQEFRLVSTWAEFKGGQIIGVVKDFTQSSLRREIKPLVLFQRPEWYFCNLIKINPGQTETALASLQSSWSKVNPDYPLNYNFVDDLFAQLYYSEKRQGNILGLFALIGIVVTYLGLLGLLSYTIEKRRREIGIRKVLGANTGNIISLIVGEFILLIILANVIAWPLSWFVMNKWLDNFAYRVDANLMIFIGSGLSALILALVVIGWQAYRASNANPVEAIHQQ